MSFVTSSKNDLNTRVFDKKELGHCYYIGVNLQKSSQDLVSDERQKLGDAIAQSLHVMDIDGLNIIDRDRWHITIGWKIGRKLIR